MTYEKEVYKVYTNYGQGVKLLKRSIDGVTRITENHLQIGDYGELWIRVYKGDKLKISIPAYKCEYIIYSD